MISTTNNSGNYCPLEDKLCFNAGYSLDGKFYCIGKTLLCQSNIKNDSISNNDIMSAKIKDINDIRKEAFLAGFWYAAIDGPLWAYTKDTLENTIEFKNAWNIFIGGINDNSR
jgi:hypothetical protein